ncbi:MAG: Gldg family protein [Lachnospiraceae bacterium]|nr:Gldg family protein [Lachnospiraceae bacterium]
MEKKHSGKASLKHGSYSIMLTILVLGFLIAVNILIHKLPVSWVSYDMSDVKIYSIGDKSREVARSIDEEVTIYLIGKDEEYDHILSQMLDLYEDLSSKIHVKKLDINRDLSILTEYGVDQMTIEEGSLLVVSAERSKFIPEADIYELDYAKTAQAAYKQYYYNYDGEGEVTSALIYVTTDEIPKIYTIAGHNEIPVGETISSSIKKANYDIHEVNLTTAKIPADCDILMVNAPAMDYSPDECNQIRDFVDKGGHLLISCTYENYDMENFRNLLLYCGIELKQGVVFEQADHSRDPNSPFVFFANVSSSHSLTKDMSQNSYVYTHIATGLYTSSTKKNSVAMKPFLQTTDGAFQRVNYKTESKITKTSEDISGPVTIGLTAEDSLTGMKMVAFGTANLVDDSILVTYPNVLNSDLYISALNYLCAFDRSVSIPVKNTDFGNNLYMASSRNKALIITVGVLPVLVLLIGFGVWYRRRNR